MADVKLDGNISIGEGAYGVLFSGTAPTADPGYDRAVSDLISESKIARQNPALALSFVKQVVALINKADSSKNDLTPLRGDHIHNLYFVAIDLLVSIKDYAQAAKLLLRVVNPAAEHSPLYDLRKVNAAVLKDISAGSVVLDKFFDINAMRANDMFWWMSLYQQVVDGVAASGKGKDELGALNRFLKNNPGLTL